VIGFRFEVIGSRLAGTLDKPPDEVEDKQNFTIHKDHKGHEDRK
jgi:hypothetical protein